MIPIDKAVIARYERSGKCFEILVDPDSARRFRSNELSNLDEVIASREIFSDSKKGDRAAESDLNTVFSTNNFDEIAKIIISKGEIQLTTEQRRKMQEQREKQIITLIARDGIDPRTKMPHPVARIENCFKEAKVHIDPFKSAEEQVDTVIKALRAILPIKIEKIKVAIMIPAEHAGKASAFIHRYSVIKEEWKGDGSYLTMIELSPGLQEEFYTKLNKLTEASCETKIVE